MKTEQIDTIHNITEASGVARHGDSLLLVTDGVPGAYFTVAISGLSKPLLKMPLDHVARHPLSGGDIAVDLEAIDVLADGRIVALSERLRSLIGVGGLIAQYDDPLSEVGERGLEGLAVRRLPDGGSCVAVLWEGGYMEDSDLEPQLRERIQGKPSAWPEPLLPVIYTHSIKPNSVNNKYKIQTDKDLIHLRVPAADADPKGWRFRAPDLVWHEWRVDGGRPELGFIVLLNSQLPRKRSDKNKFGPRWLQRFDHRGDPVGDHLDLDEEIRKYDSSLIDANWEGLGWYEEGRSLVLVRDVPKPTDEVATAFVIDVPHSWL